MVLDLFWWPMNPGSEDEKPACEGSPLVSCGENWLLTLPETRGNEAQGNGS